MELTLKPTDDKSGDRIVFTCMQSRKAAGMLAAVTKLQSVEGVREEKL